VPVVGKIVMCSSEVGLVLMMQGRDANRFLRGVQCAGLGLRYAPPTMKVNQRRRFRWEYFALLWKPLREFGIPFGINCTAWSLVFETQFHRNHLFSICDALSYDFEVIMFD